MKKGFILSFSICIFSSALYSQTIWLYDFGTATGSFNTPNSTSTFLPDPTSGLDQVRVGDAGGGFELVNLSGTDSELKITASTNSTDGSVNKFSICGYSPSQLFTIRFTTKMVFKTSITGHFYFFIGSGSYFLDDVRWNGDNVYMGIRWEKLSSNDFANTALINNSFPYSWSDISQSYFSGSVITIDIYGNNSGASIGYEYPIGNLRTLPPYQYSLFIDGNFIGNLSKGSGTMPDDQPIDSYMILGEWSDANEMQLFIDDIFYSNDIVSPPLPVELSSFTATYIGKNINLNWRTETEVNNYGFEVERKVGNSSSSVSNPIETDFEKIGFVNGNGNSNSPKEYSFIDSNPLDADKYLYRLKQIDNDGKFEYSKVVEVSLMKPNEFILEQNYPNPFNPVTTIPYSLSTSSNIKLTVFNILGEEISTLVNEYKEAGSHSANFNASLLNSGIYFYKLESTGNTQVRKMSLLK